MTELTAVQADTLERYSSGQTVAQIAKANKRSTNSVSATINVLLRRGMIKKIGRGGCVYTGIPYTVIPPTERKPPLHVDPDILDYIKGHYPLYRNKRGVLAKKLGMTRTLLNQIVIEHKLGGESA